MVGTFGRPAIRSSDTAARIGRSLAFATAGLSVIAMMVPPSSACDIGPAPWNGTPRPSTPTAFSTASMTRCGWLATPGWP